MSVLREARAIHLDLRFSYHICRIKGCPFWNWVEFICCWWHSIFRSSVCPRMGRTTWASEDFSPPLLAVFTDVNPSVGLSARSLAFASAFSSSTGSQCADTEKCEGVRKVVSTSPRALILSRLFLEHVVKYFFFFWSPPTHTHTNPFLFFGWYIFS